MNSIMIKLSTAQFNTLLDFSHKDNYEWDIEIMVQRDGTKYLKYCEIDAVTNEPTGRNMNVRYLDDWRFFDYLACIREVLDLHTGYAAPSGCWCNEDNAPVYCDECDSIGTPFLVTINPEIVRIPVFAN